MHRGRDLGDFKMDLVVEGLVLVELKAVRAVESAHEKQVFNYLKVTNIEVGLLFNFGPKPQMKRFLLENQYKHQRAVSASA